MSWVFIFVLLTFASSAHSAKQICKSSQPYKIVCYLGSWANYRGGEGKFTIEDIDPSLCTHLIYGFAKLGPDSRIAPYDPYLDLKENWGLGAFERLNNLKKKNTELKTLIAIGGWNEGSTKYSQMAANPSSRATFVKSVVDFCDKYGFDGLDVDWEYPANRGGAASDKQTFVLLLKELKEAFVSRKLSLTAAVSAGQPTIDAAYDVQSLGKYLDAIHLMAYDFHGGWDQQTGHNAPLFSKAQDSAEHRKLNVDYAVKYWLSKGVPSHKLILGMPFYGRSFTLKSSDRHSLGAPVLGSGMAGPFTQEQGFLGYNEVCSLIKTDKGWEVTRDAGIQAPYAVKDKHWIGFDDIQSIAKKVEYIVQMRLGGGMVWSIETDDFLGKCHGKTYPLLRTINEGLGHCLQTITPDIRTDPTAQTTTPDIRIDPTSRTSSTPAVSFTAVEEQTTLHEPLGEAFHCTKTGYFRHPTDCKRFFYCLAMQPGSSEFVSWTFTCPQGTVFNEQKGVCDFSASVPECNEQNEH